MKCELCGKEVYISSWPFCPHESTRSERALRFGAIVVHKKADGTYSFPANASAPVPDGYTKVEITTRRQAEKLTREVNRQIREEKDRIGPSPMDSDGSGLHQLKRLARGERVTIPDHDAHGNLIMRVLDGSQMRGKFREYVERLAEKNSQPSYSPSYDPGFHLDVMENNSSNRAPHDDASTGWKSRRE